LIPAGSKSVYPMRGRHPLAARNPSQHPVIGP